MLAGDCEIIDIDLTTRLLKLWQNVSRESANNRFLVEGSKRDECLTTEQVPEVIGVRLMLGVGGYVSELTTEKIKSSLMDLTWSGPSLHVRMMPILEPPNFVLGRLPCCVTSLLLRNIVAAP